METYRSRSGHYAFSLTELLFVIAGVAMMAALIILPALAKAKSKDTRMNCINNLKQTGLAFRMWSDDHVVYPMKYRTNNFDGPTYAIQQKMFVYFQTMSNELSTPKILVCPSDDRNPALNFDVMSNTNISYFVGLDADETMPQILLAGDRKLTINGIPASTGLVVIKSTDTIGWDQTTHRGQGNVALADGSVAGYTQVGFQQALRHTGSNANRLAVP